MAGLGSNPKTENLEDPEEKGFRALARMSGFTDKLNRLKRAPTARKHYYLMVEDYEWDYAPTGTDLYFTGKSLTEPGT